MTWQPRRTHPTPLDPNRNITWTGTVEGTWHPNYHTISVLWDAGQQGLGNRRRRVLPEAVLPDPTIVYIDIATVTPSMPHEKTNQPTRPKPQSQGTEKTLPTTVTTKRGISIILPKTAQPKAKTHTTAREGPGTADHIAPAHPTDIMSEPTLRMHPKAKGRLNPGDRVCPRAWYIFPDRPPHVSRLAWEATSHGVRQQHIKWLREIRSMPADLLDMDLPQAILELVRRRALANKWKWATIERQLATAKSALANITLYTNIGNPILIDTDPEWRQAKRGAARFKSETPPEPPPPITIAQYNEAKALLRADPKAQLLLTMLWAFAARAGDICSLKPENINIGKPTREGLMRIALTVRKGKGAAFRGPYPIPSTMTRADTQELQRWMAQTDATHRIFRDTTQLKTRVKHALRKVLPKAALPSVRKGAARHLATTGMAEEDLMQLLGHTRLETTRQYLGYGEHLTVNQRRAQLQTGALQSCGHLPTSEDETDVDSESESQ
jgi:integrase